MKTIRIALSVAERQKLRQNALKIIDLANYAPDEIGAMLNADSRRSNVIAAQIAFQSIPSIGPKFAQDLISLGYYSLDELLGKDGPTLLNQLESAQGFWTDPCVEDQFWLVVHYAQNRGSIKNWWDFTPARKAYRAEHGYPPGRPSKAWYDQPAAQVHEIV